MIIEHKSKEDDAVFVWEFPCHAEGITSGSIVLFFEDKHGIVVKSNGVSRMPVGRFEKDWMMSDFIPCPKGTSTTFTDE